MQKFILLVFVSSVLFLIGCQPQTGNTNANLVNTNANLANAFANKANTNMTNMNSFVSVIESKEPDVYQAESLRQIKSDRSHAILLSADNNLLPFWVCLQKMGYAI